jgi:hypothetical protein
MGQDQSRSHRPTDRELYEREMKLRKLKKMRLAREQRVGRVAVARQVVTEPRYLPRVVNDAKYLPEKLERYPVHREQEFEEDITVPIYQDVVQPIVQPFVLQPQPIVDTRIHRKIRPVVTRRVHPKFRREVEQVEASPAIYNDPTYDDERLEAIYRVERAPLEYDESIEYEYENEY